MLALRRHTSGEACAWAGTRRGGCMRYYAFGLLLFCSIVFGLQLSLSQSATQTSISTSNPDYSLALLPDTQYYTGKNSYVFQDQVNWVIASQSRLNIKAVIGLGDIVDGGGYPVDSSGNVIGGCAVAPPSAWQSQWQQAQAAIA